MYMIKTNVLAPAFHYLIYIVNRNKFEKEIIIYPKKLETIKFEYKKGLYSQLKEILRK